jgi:hypothetical protein
MYHERAALRVLYEAFYYFCGYVDGHDRPRQRWAPNLALLLTHRIGGQMQQEQGQRSQAAFLTKYEAVQSAKRRLPEFTPKDLQYLVGRRSEYQLLNEAHHACDLRALAAYTERYMKEKSASRQLATLKMFRRITHYHSYRAAYTNVNEMRSLTRYGLSSSEIQSDSKEEGNEDRADDDDKET